MGHAVSPDLRSWEVRPPLSSPTPAGFGQLEVIQVEEVYGRAVLIFSCLSGEASDFRQGASPRSDLGRACSPPRPGRSTSRTPIRSLTMSCTSAGWYVAVATIRGTCSHSGMSIRAATSWAGSPIRCRFTGTATGWSSTAAHRRIGTASYAPTRRLRMIAGPLIRQGPAIRRGHLGGPWPDGWQTAGATDATRRHAYCSPSGEFVADELTGGRVVLASYAERQPCVTPVIGVIVSRYPSRSSSLTSIVIPPIKSRGL